MLRKAFTGQFTVRAVDCDIPVRAMNLADLRFKKMNTHCGSSCHATIAGAAIAIWNEFTDQPFELPPDKRLTLATYQV